MEAPKSYFNIIIIYSHLAITAVWRPPQLVSIRLCFGHLCISFFRIFLISSIEKYNKHKYTINISRTSMVLVQNCNEKKNCPKAFCNILTGFHTIAETAINMHPFNFNNSETSWIFSTLYSCKPYLRVHTKTTNIFFNHI